MPSTGRSKHFSPKSCSIERSKEQRPAKKNLFRHDCFWLSTSAREFDASLSLSRDAPVELQQMEAQLTNLEHDLRNTSSEDDDAAKAWLSQLLVIKRAGCIEQVAILPARANLSTLAVGSI